MKLTFCAAILIGMHLAANAADPGMKDFITARDGKLFEGGKEFRFLSFNIPNLLLIEDNVPFAGGNPWRLPDVFEIHDALATTRQLGGTVARTYTISVRRTNDTALMPRHVLGPGRFDEQSFRALDEALAAAHRNGVRLIIPLVDNWPWMGGRAEYAGFRGKTKNDFWSDPQLLADFKQTIHFVLTRTNTITGMRYADDPAILCWETGNEVESPASWTREIAHYIKSIDPRHLVMDGYSSAVRQEILEAPEVDIVTTHHYPGAQKSFADQIRENAAAAARVGKPFVVGEFGFVSTEQMEKAMQAIAGSSASGGLLWSLRFRNRDGGFYWHSEPYGGNLYKAFHWPGSTLGDPYDETRLMNAVRLNAFAMRGLPVPDIGIPSPPTLLPIGDPAAISWQGSVAASRYQVERAAQKSGPWEVIASDVDEAFTQYRPQFADEKVPAGTWFYRVRAKNATGHSDLSNVVGPVMVKTATLVDELADFSRISAKTGEWKIADRDCRCAKEDAHRAAGTSGSALVYQLPAKIDGVRVFVFFPKTESVLKLAISGDGKDFRDIPVQKSAYFQGAGDYGYWMPVLFHADNLSGGRYLRIDLTGDAQIGRVEISHPALQK